VTEEDLARDAFGTHPKFRVVIAEWDGQAVGYALFFEFYSSFRAGRIVFWMTCLSAPNSARKGLEGPCSRTWPGSRGRKIFLHALGSAELEHAGNKLYSDLGAVFMEEWKSAVLIGDPCKPWRKEAK